MNTIDISTLTIDEAVYIQNVFVDPDSFPTVDHDLVVSIKSKFDAVLA